MIKAKERLRMTDKKDKDNQTNQNALYNYLKCKVEMAYFKSLDIDEDDIDEDEERTDLK